MTQAKTSPSRRPYPASMRKRPAAKATSTESSLLFMRMKELDHEFARQTRQLTALTKRLAKNLAVRKNNQT